MKRALTVILSVMMLAFGAVAFAACGDGNEENDNGGNTSVEVYLPDGTPALAMAKAMTEGVDIEGYDVNFHIIAAGNIGTVFTATDANLAIMPTIGAATNFTKGTEIQLVSTNVFGNLYIVGVNSAVDSLDDLTGKLVYTTAATTIQLLQYLLDENGITYATGSEAAAGQVTLYSVPSASDIIPVLKMAETNGMEAYGVLGEPQVTQCKAKVPTAQSVIDFQAEWTDITGFDGYPQASLIVENDFSAEHGAFVEAFARALEDNGEWLSSEDNIAAFKQALVEYNEAQGEDGYQTSLANLTLTPETIEGCNLGYQSASEVKDSVRDYIKRLSGTELPDAFFYAV